MRPNVALELGWFYGQLGRAKTCILLRKGTTLPSDLAGVDTPFFERTVKEVLHAIEQELIAAEVISARHRECWTQQQGIGVILAQLS